MPEPDAVPLLTAALLAALGLLAMLSLICRAYESELDAAHASYRSLEQAHTLLLKEHERLLEDQRRLSWRAWSPCRFPVTEGETMPELTDAELKYLLERWDASPPDMQRRIVALLVQQLAETQAEVARLQSLCDSLAARCHAQSELLGRRAEGRGDACQSCGEPLQADEQNSGRDICFDCYFREQGG